MPGKQYFTSSGKATFEAVWDALLDTFLCLHICLVEHQNANFPNDMILNIFHSYYICHLLIIYHWQVGSRMQLTVYTKAQVCRVATFNKGLQRAATSYARILCRLLLKYPETQEEE